MAGFIPAIRLFLIDSEKDVDTRHFEREYALSAGHGDYRNILP